jgi:hypothetical protein
MQRIRIETRLDQQQLDALETSARSLRTELEGLQAGTVAFARTLNQLSATQQQLEAVRLGITQIAEAQATVTQQAETAQTRDTTLNQQRLDALRNYRDAQALLLNAQAEQERTLAETQLAQATDHITQRMALLDQLSQRQQQQVDYERQLTDARLQLSQVALTAFTELEAAFGQGNSDFSAAQRALFAFNKATAIRDVIIATQKEIAAVSATYAAAPPVAAALTAKAIASGAVRVGIIAAQALPQLAEGGVLAGPAHSHGGVVLHTRSGQALAEAEGGEVVLTRGVSRNAHLLELASRINQLAGGVQLRSLQTRAPRTYLAEGGVLSTSFVPETATTTAQLLQLTQALEALAARPAVVSVQEINRVQDRVRVLEQAREV